MTRLPAFTLAALALAWPAHGADMTFFMKNRQPVGVAVELFSRDRDMVWPGGDKVYFLDEAEKKSVTVSCEEGENICYGAWVNGDDRTYWGVGPDNALPPCEYCCFLCVDKTTEAISIGER